MFHKGTNIRIHTSFFGACFNALRILVHVIYEENVHGRTVKSHSSEYEMGRINRGLKIKSHCVNSC